MKKALFIVILIVISIILMAVTERVIALDEEIELIFKNVKIKDIEFYDQNEVEVDFSKSDDVKVTKEKNVIPIVNASQLKCLIDAVIPARKWLVPTKVSYMNIIAAVNMHANTTFQNLMLRASLGLLSIFTSFNFL